MLQKEKPEMLTHIRINPFGGLSGIEPELRDPQTRVLTVTP